MSRPKSRRWSVEPIVKEVRKHFESDAALGDAKRRDFYRIQRVGTVTTWAADRWAIVVLGRQPHELWADWYEEAG